MPTSRNLSVNEKAEKTYVFIFQVISDNKYEDPNTVVASTGATIGTYLNPYARCNNISADCISEDGLQWIVTLTYGKLDREPNPLDQRPDYQWGFAQFQKSIDKDINGEAILNSAKDPFSEPIEIDDSRPVLKVTRNEFAFDPALASKYRDAVNATTFKGYKAGQVKVSNISSVETKDENIGYYWKTSYEFHFNPEGWDKVLLDQGYRQFVSSKKLNILVQGVPATEPVLLDGNGYALPSGGTPKFKEFRVYPRLPFTIFNF